MGRSKYLLGYDVGSSSIKSSIIDSDTGKLVGTATSPKQEMEMQSAQAGWAEQDPDSWWGHLVKATHELISDQAIDKDLIEAIGISYQMHGLVAVDKTHKPLRPSIIWCDSRAAEIGERAFREIGPEICLKHFLNSPGNFTASKLKWVKENEPEIYEKIYKIMLPGDYIALKLTGEICTTISGLSEGILWDFKENKVADKLLAYYGISSELLPKAMNSFEIHGELTRKAADQLGLQKGTKVSYRAPPIP